MPGLTQLNACTTGPIFAKTTDSLADSKTVVDVVDLDSDTTYNSTYSQETRYMKINLRKAGALIAEVKSAAKAITAETSVNINLYSENIERDVEAARVRLLKNIERRTGLEKAYAELRGAVGRANAASGISDLLAQDAYLETQEGFLRAVAATVKREDDTTVRQMVEARRKSSEGNTRNSIYGYDANLALSVLTALDIETYELTVREVRKTRRELKDRTVELNVRTEIEVPSAVESVLREEGLI